MAELRDSIDLRMTRLRLSSPFVDVVLPTFQEATGLQSWLDLVDEKETGIPEPLIKAIDNVFLKNGLRPCDTLVRIPGRDKVVVPIWRIFIPESIDPGLRKRQTRGIKRTTKVGDTTRYEVSSSFFWEMIHSLLSRLHTLSMTWYVNEKLRELDLKSPNEDNHLGNILLKCSKADYGTHQYRTWSRFAKFLFFKGHKFGPIEQGIMAVHLNTLQFTDLALGIYSKPKAAAGLILNLIMNPDTVTKSYKKFTSRIEDDLFEYIGSDPSIPELVDPDIGQVLTEYFDQPVFNFLFGPLANEQKDFETTLKWIECFCPSRNLPKPDDVSTVDVYEDYLGYLTTTTDIGVRVTAEERRQFTEGPDGRYVEDFLSRVISGQILSRVPKDRKAADALLGKSTPIEKLSNSSTLMFTRKNRGHYGEIAKVMTIFLNSEVGKSFPYVETTESEKFIVDDYGTRLCHLRYCGLPVWQIAFLEEPLCPSETKLFSPNTQVPGSTFGLDHRFGSLIFLYGAYTCRPWIQSMDEYVEQGGEPFKTEQEVRDAVSCGKLIVPTMRTVPVLEPGGKVRWVSASEGALTYFQIAFAEDLRDLYTNVEGARVGLASDNHLFRFEQSFADHTLDKILRPKDRELFTPSAIRLLYETGVTEGWKPLVFEAKVLIQLAISTAESFKVSHAAAVLSLLPLGADLQSVLIDEMRISQTTAHLDFRLKDDILDYKSWEASILATSIAEEIITCQTSDMVKATDTFRHDHHHRNLESVLRNLGYDVDGSAVNRLPP